MKTQHELKYEELITAMILSNTDTNYSQLDLFMDFHRNQSAYYDRFCESLYSLSQGELPHSLWLTPSGKPYIADTYRSADDLLILTHKDVPCFEDDLKEQLETALSFMQKIVAPKTSFSISS